MSSKGQSDHKNTSLTKEPLPMHQAPVVKEALVAPLSNDSKPANSQPLQQQPNADFLYNYQFYARKVNKAWYAAHVATIISAALVLCYSCHKVAECEDKIDTLEKIVAECTFSPEVLNLDNFKSLGSLLGLSKMQVDSIVSSYKANQFDVSSLIYSCPAYCELWSATLRHASRIYYAILICCASLRCIIMPVYKQHRNTLTKFVVLSLTVFVFNVCCLTLGMQFSYEVIVLVLIFGLYYFLAFKAMQDITGKQARQLLPVYYVEM